MQNKKIAKQVLMVVIGQIILGMGVSFILFAGLGIDAFGVFHAGVAKTFNITFGLAMFFESLIALIAIYFIDKSYINFATLVSLFLVGFTADYMMIFLEFIFSNNLDFIIRLILVFIGSGILGIGLNIYVLADLGVGALDAIAEMISAKTKYEYQVVKMANDLFFLSIGWLLGGHVGIATIITAVILGPIIQFIRKRVSKPINTWLNEPAVN